MSKQKLVIGWLSALTAFAAGADSPPVGDTLRARWITAYNSGDVEALGAMYSADARLKQGYCPVVHGRDAIEAFWRDDMSEGGVTTHMRVEDTFSTGDLVYLSGSYAVEFVDKTDEPASIGGTYLQIWRRGEAADWTIFRETWTNLACAEIRVGPNDEEATEAVARTTGV